MIPNVAWYNYAIEYCAGKNNKKTLNRLLLPETVNEMSNGSEVMIFKITMIRR